jgi:Pvc16 N-terminal domain
VIPDVDKALKDLIEQAVPGTPVMFDAPTRAWSDQIGTAQAINVFLYDLRQDPAYTSVGAIGLRQQPAGWVSSTSPTHTIDPPCTYLLSYMITAWYSDPGDMHRILQDILIELTSHATLDIAFSDVLKPLNPTAVMFVADPPDTRTVSELWSSLGNTPLPNISCMVTLPLDRYRRDEPGLITDPLVREVTVDVRATAP